MTDLKLDRQAVGAKHRGAWAETVACAWLLQQGYEVFRNISPSGAIDLVAIKGGEVLKFDVKAFADLKVLPCRTAEQRALGVQFLVIRDDGTVEISDGNAPVAPIVCRICEKPFLPRHRSQRICSQPCKTIASKQAAYRYAPRKKPVECDEIFGAGFPDPEAKRDVDPLTAASRGIP